MANGAAIDDYASDSKDSDTKVTYTVKDSAGKDVDSKYLDTTTKADTLVINACLLYTSRCV